MKTKINYSADLGGKFMQGIVQPLPVRLKCECCGAEFSLVPDGSLGYDLPLFYLLIPRRKVKLKSLPKLFKSFILPHR